MSKRKISTKTINLILMACSALFTVLSLVGLALNFITVYTKNDFLKVDNQESWNVSTWFDSIDGLTKGEMNGIGNWQFARVMLIVAAVVLVLMLVMTVLAYFVKHPAVKWTTVGIGMSVVVCLVIFMVVTLMGCGALSGTILGTQITYSASVGTFMFGICGIIAAILTESTVLRK